MPEGAQINQLFSGIAKRYDVANHLLSCGFDFNWRRKLVEKVKAERPQKVIDLATGSGDVAFALKRALGDDVHVSGMDFCKPMLEEAEKKKEKKSFAKDVLFKWGDCLDLPLEDASVDVMTIAFGYRNLENRLKALHEVHRVLKPGGSLFILEFSQPYRWFSPFYYFYLKYFLPQIGKMITKKQEAYEYLTLSIESFPSRNSLIEEISQSPLEPVSCKALTFGTVAIHHAKKL